MTISAAKVERYSESHILGTAVLTHKKGSEEVMFVAPVPAKDFDPHGTPLLEKARYFASPLVANINWKDQSAGTKVNSAFTGRDEGSMEAYLVANYKG